MEKRTFAALPIVLRPAVPAAVLVAVLVAGCGSDEPTAPLPELQAVTEWVDSAARSEAPTRESITPVTPAVAQAAPVSDMISGLKQRLEENPADLKGWRLLAQSYAFIGNMHAARGAIAEAVELGADAQELEALVHRAHTGGRR